MVTTEPNRPTNFIRNIIDEDIKNNGQVVTRFPPEPNGFLHIGHAKSICLNFGIARDYQGQCHLRFDDTNPSKESEHYIQAIKEDVQWLGFHWDGPIRFASAYFNQLFDYAVELINADKAFVCDLTPDQIRETRGTLTKPGSHSPFRTRSTDENLTLFMQMRDGKFVDGSHTLRAKIDMASPNINLRDPVLYRIMRTRHHQTGDAWVIYPMYDFTHCISDAIEGITHSLCTLEFADHRPLYDWCLDNISADCHPQQIEFSRLALEYTITSKRKLATLVEKQWVSGWDDPRMPTIAGLRQRGYTPASIRDFCERIGVTKVDNTIEMGLLEYCIRLDLEDKAPRAMGVLRPLRIIIENYPEGQVEQLSAPCHPQNESLGTRTLPFTREIFIDQDDFREDAPKKYKRLITDGEVRLRNAYIIQCRQVIKDETSGEIIELRCTYDDKTLGKAPEGRKVKGVIHWVSASHSLPAEIRLYDRLFTTANPEADDTGQDFTQFINPNSLEIINNAFVESNLANATPGDRYQFEREGYFYIDNKHPTKDKLVINRIVTLRDSWTKIAKKNN